MKPTTTRSVILIVFLVTITALTALRPAQAKKNPGNQSSTNDAAIYKPAKGDGKSVEHQNGYYGSNGSVIPPKKPESPVDRSSTKAGSTKIPGNSDPGKDGKHLSVKPTLKTREIPNGVEKTSSAGVVRERSERHPDGEHAQYFTATGRKQREEVTKPDGTVQKTFYNPVGRVSRQEVVHPDGSREVSNQQWGRDNKVRLKETVEYDSNRKAVSKTVEKTVIINKTASNTVIVNHYDAGPYGFVYRPVVASPQVFVAWYDPYWYAADGVAIYHPFHYTWGWEHDAWYQSSRGVYWTPYNEYPAPSYWVTDRVMADYMADHYEDQTTPEQAQEEVRQAQADAARAQQVAQDSQDAAEIAEAKIEQSQAELRAKNAEDKVAQLEKDGADQKANTSPANPNATPMDEETKQAIVTQVDVIIADDKQRAEQVAKGENPPLPDVSKSLADTQHVYLVSTAVSVTLAKDSSPAGTLSEGDALKLGPGQESALKDITETTLLTMRVMSSKGEDGEVTAGTLILMPVTELQDDDNTLHAKADVGKAEADDKMGEFRRGGRSG